MLVFICDKSWGARSWMYRSRLLQVNIRVAAFPNFELYKIQKNEGVTHFCTFHSCRTRPRRLYKKHLDLSIESFFRGNRAALFAANESLRRFFRGNRTAFNE